MDWWKFTSVATWSLQESKSIFLDFEVLCIIVLIDLENDSELGVDDAFPYVREVSLFLIAHIMSNTCKKIVCPLQPMA